MKKCKKNVKKIIASAMGVFLCAAMLAGSPANAMYNERIEPMDEDSVVAVYGDLENPDSYQNTVDELLSDETVNEVIVYDLGLLEENMNEVFDGLIDEDSEEMQVSPFAAPQVSAWIYSVSNIKNGSDYTGTSAKASASGEPGITLEISKTVSVEHTFNTSVNLVANKKINAAVGFGSSLSSKISIKGTAPVPKKVSGKSVKKMTLKAYPIYKTKTYSIIGQRTALGKVEKVTKGSGTARKPYGVAFKKTYTYK